LLLSAGKTLNEEAFFIMQRNVNEDGLYRTSVNEATFRNNYYYKFLEIPLTFRAMI